MFKFEVKLFNMSTQRASWAPRFGARCPASCGIRAVASGHATLAQLLWTGFLHTLKIDENA